MSKKAIDERVPSVADSLISIDMSKLDSPTGRTPRGT